MKIFDNTTNTIQSEKCFHSKIETKKCNEWNFKLIIATEYKDVEHLLTLNTVQSASFRMNLIKISEFAKIDEDYSLFVKT